MNWEERPLETHVKWLLKEKLKSEGDALWNIYESTRNELVKEVLPWIAAHEPNLTDHGPKHISDVIDNAALLLGFQNHHGENTETTPYSTNFTPYEMLILLSGLLMHDIGNILGREKHNLKITEVWNKLNSWKSWPSQERQAIINVGRAHAGKKDEDTLKPLSVSEGYFFKQRVNLANIAAIVRFADELAEGEQRTSRFLIENRLIKEESNLYHQYAQITRVSIGSDRIALTYYIDIDNPSYPTKDKRKLKKHLKDLLNMVYARAAKMNQERQLARHYAKILVPFRETSISVNFLKDDSLIDLPLEPIMLNDFNISLSAPHKQIEKLNSNYNITQLVEKVLGGNSAKVN